MPVIQYGSVLTKFHVELAVFVAGERVIMLVTF